MPVFEDCSVVLELRALPYKEKKKLRSAITDNGGSVCFVVNKQCSLVVTSDLSSLSPNRLRSVQKHHTPVVRSEYVYSCLSSGLRLPVDAFQLDPSSPPRPSSHQVSKQTGDAAPRGPSPERTGNVLDKFRIYTQADLNLPSFPDTFQVAKYCVFEKVNSGGWSVLELQSAEGGDGRRYRVVRSQKEGTKKAVVKDQLVFVSTSEDAVRAYLALKDVLQGTGLRLRSDNPPEAEALGSGPLQQLLLEEKLNTGSVSHEVGVFVELLWTEALGCLADVLSVKTDKLSLSDVSRAEGLLLQAQRKLKDGNDAEAATLVADVYALLPHNAPQWRPTLKLISQKLDLCQLIRDVLSVREMTLRNPLPSCVGKYRALRCSIEALPPSSSEFQAVTVLLQDRKVQIQQVLRVSRGVELQMFRSDLGNVRTLLHSSSPAHFVGILSRGLLLPRVGVEHHGIERTDIGNLGSGIYFSDAISTSLKYSSPSVTDGSRLLLVCDVALGSCRDLHKRDATLTQAPEGHHSVHGVQRTPQRDSDFEDHEYVVYSPDQVKLKYVVQFSLEGEQLKEFSPLLSTSAELCLLSIDQGENHPPSSDVYVEDDGVESATAQQGVKAGLLDSAGQQLPLQAVHVKAKLMDLLSQVIIFQKYTNTSSVPIEAKYVFPLDESAAVCGFEAFINGKHIVGQVKEKEAARKEYRQAVEKGHGAYLMDQDAPDVFTISVGNLPPGATVLIKVTFVSELIVKDGSVVFSLPGSVAPWQESAALNQTTQVTLEKVCVTDDAAGSREFSLDVSVEMPNEISCLRCLTHKVQIKKTDCKAVLRVLPGQLMGPEGFQLSVSLSEVHLPRMWVEKHPDKDSQACMLVFYPEFEIDSSSAFDEVVLLLDASESMRGESFRAAQRITLRVLKTLDPNLRVNIILFGTDHKEAFPTARPLGDAREAAEQFIKLFTAVGGSTELWRPLRALSLLPPSRGIRNLLLLSDGHIQNPEPTLRLLRAGAQHSRLFSCGLSSTANRHMLRALAQAGAGAYDFFDTKTKHTWPEKVARQVKRMTSPGCSSVSVKWQQFSASAPTPVQAPQQIHALFNDCHTLVYGFVPHCTQATLLGNLSGQELKTMVSTSELQKTRGTFLHKLTARALIRDYEDGNLDVDEAEHEGKKAELKSYIVELSKEFSILSQFTSFVAVEERDSDQTGPGVTDIPELVEEEDVDILPYISWISSEETVESMDDSDDSVYANYLDNSDYLDDWGISSNIASVPAIREEETTLQVAGSESEQTYGDVSASPAPAKHQCLFDDSSVFGQFPLSQVMGRPPLRMRALPLSFFSPAPSPPRQLFSSGALHLQSSFAPIQGPAAPPPPSQLFSFAPILGPRPPPTPLSHAYTFDAPPPPPPAGGFGSSVFSAGLAIGAASEPGTRKAALRDFGAPPHTMPYLPTCFIPPCSTQRSESVSPDVPPPPEVAAYSTLPPSRGGYIAESEDMLSLVSASPDVPPPSSVHGQADAVPAPRFRRRPARMARSMAAPSPMEKSALDECPPPSAPFQATAVDPVPQVAVSEGAAAPPPPPISRCMAEEPVGSAMPDFKRISKPFRERARISRLESEDTEPSESRWRPAMLNKCRRMSPAETLKRVVLSRIFPMQQTDGYWELTTELGELIHVDVDLFKGFLKSKGISSLGVRAHAEILRLVATLLVLQLMRALKLAEGKQLRTLFCLEESEPRPRLWKQVKSAVDWVCSADRQYPCIYSRLEFGFSWESATRQLLGYEDLPPLSPLVGVSLQKRSP